MGPEVLGCFGAGHDIEKWCCASVGAVEVRALLVQMPLDHWDRKGGVAPNLGRGEGRPGGKKSGIDSSAPGAQCGTEQGGMIKSDAGGQGGAIGKVGGRCYCCDGMGLVLRLDLHTGSRGNVDRPEARGGTSTSEHKIIVFGDGAPSGRKCSGAPGITEKTD